MGRKLLIGGLVSTALLVGTLVGVSYGGGGGITEPRVIELTHSSCGKDAHCWFYQLKAGPGFGQLVQGRIPSYDVDGNLVGTSHAWVTTASGTGSIATVIERLKDGANTDRGSVTLTGFVQRNGCYFGDEVCTFAVTGGSGAYVNVRGYATVESDPEGIRTTLYLIP